MENTRENVTALLNELAKTAYTVSQVLDDHGNKVDSESIWGEYHAYTMAIRLLNDNAYFNEIREIVYGGENK